MDTFRAGRFAAAFALLAALLVAPAAAHAEPPVASCPLPPVPSTTQPGYTVADPRCELTGAPFVPLIDAAGAPISTVHTGIADGAAYRIEKPLDWNGELVLYAHGYRGQGTTVYVDNPGALRAHYIARGFAWAASSYQTNGYDVAQGVRDSQALIGTFAAVTGTAASSVYMTGASMGGHITAVAVEKYRHTFAGAMPYCGSIGDTELYDYFLDANVIAAALTGNRIEFPAEDPPAEWEAAFRESVKQRLPLLGTNLGTANPTFTPLGRT
ncbi:phthalyl amidase, partial [Actinoplanes sp. NPDC051633]